MKKILKQLSSIGLAVMLMLSLCVPAFATSTPSNPNETPAAITSSGDTANVVVGVADPAGAANGLDTLYAYKVVTITFDATSNTLENTFTDLFKAFLPDTMWESLTPTQYGELTEDALKPLLGAFTAYIKTNNITPGTDDRTEEANADGVATFKDMAMGQYIIVGAGATEGAKIYQTVTAEVQPVKGDDGKFALYSSYTVSMKTSTPTIGKSIEAGTVEDTLITGNNQGEGDKHDVHQQTAEIGQDVTYKLTIAVPTYPEGATNTTFYAGDILSKGLTLKPESVIVTGFASAEDTTGAPLALDTAYTVKSATDEETGATTLHVDFNFASIVEYKTVTVTYKATVNSNAELGTANGNPNNAELIYSNAPFVGDTFKPGDSEENRPGHENGYGQDQDMEIVYTYALVIDKYEEKHENEKLSGATFELYRKWDSASNAYSEPVTNADGSTVTLVTDANGTAEYKGLHAGTYYLKETVAPTGYNLMTEAVVITVNAGTIPYTTTTTTTVYHYVYTTTQPTGASQATLNGALVWMNDKGEVATGTQPEGYDAAYVDDALTTSETVSAIQIAPGSAGAGHFLAKVPNATGAQLPSTGGIGTTIFYVVGGCLALGAVILLITKRRMQGSEE